MPIVYMLYYIYDWKIISNWWHIYSIIAYKTINFFLLYIYFFNIIEGYSSRSSKDPVILPTAPRAARGPGIDEENIPTSPPYVAYISNLPYDVDEADLADFFADMKVDFCKYFYWYKILFTQILIVLIIKYENIILFLYKLVTIYVFFCTDIQHAFAERCK